MEHSKNPAADDLYWRDAYKGRPYYDPLFGFEDYGPAYSHGASAWTRNPGRSYEDIEPELERSWADTREASRLNWDKAKHASRDAWHRMSDRVERAVPGDSDRDGK